MALEALLALPTTKTNPARTQVYIKICPKCTKEGLAIVLGHIL